MIEIKQVVKQFQNETAIDYKDIVFKRASLICFLARLGVENRRF